jgi:hypothetical protein
MCQSTSRIRTRCAAVAVAIAACLEGCYGMPRIGGHDAGVGGSGGGAGSIGDDAGGSSDGSPVGDGGTTSDGNHTGCPANCLGPTTGPVTGAGACVNDECHISCSADFPTLCSASNACVDLTSDGKNCGACGRDCLGGTCASGQCQPLLIARYLGQPATISLGADAVYVMIDSGYVGRAKKDGSDSATIARPGFASSAYYGASVSEDGERVFLVRTLGSNLQLSYCLKTGCDDTSKPIGGPYTQFFAVDSVSHKVVWVDYSPSQLWAAPTIGAVSGEPIVGGTLASGAGGSRLLYARGGVFFSDGSVVRLPISGGSLITVAAGPSPLTILTANASFLYVYDGSAIGFVPLPNGTGREPTPLVTTKLNPSIDGRFAVDDASAFWVDQGIKTCQLSTCPSSQRSLPLPSNDPVADVAIDTQAIYWVAYTYDALNGSGTAVWKMAR